MQQVQCSATAGNAAGTSNVESHVGWSEIVPEFQTSWKWRPFRCDFILGNKKKSQGAKSGGEGEWGTTAMFLAAKNCCTDKVVCTGALL
jgi:hypothetical protein